MGTHNKTPTLAVNDPRGLAILTVDYWRDEEQSSDRRIERTLRDAAGRAVKQWDARLWALQKDDLQTPSSLATVYSLNDIVLSSDSNDAGVQVELPGLAGEMLLGWDSRGTRREFEYDDLLRPIALFEQGAGEPRHCVERLSYGRQGNVDPRRNQFGQLIRHDDPAGSVLFDSFAITGQCLENTRHFTRDPVSPDWPLPMEDRQHMLEPGEGATSQWYFTVLGQMVEQVDARGNRQKFELTLDGRLRAAHLKLKHQTASQPIVSEICYTADGQVKHELAGNRVRTTQTYRLEDGRLMTRSTSSATDKLLQKLSYTYDRMGNVLSIKDDALPIRYFANQRIEPISCFKYDSLYQLIEACGWEAGGASQEPASVGRVDPAAFSNYRQTYRYDASGNLLELTHVGAQAHGRQLKTAPYSNRALPWHNGLPPTDEQITAAFDTRGNLLELDQGRSVRWNLRNQLQSVSPVERIGEHNDEHVYQYNAGGQRVRKIRSLRTNARIVINEVRYLPGLELRTDSGSGEVLQVITAQSGVNCLNVLHWETSPPTGGNDRYRYIFTDHLGSASLELAEDARIISQQTYYPFGETAWNREAEVSYRTVRYSGKERDATGLYEYGRRYYIPWLQRWINPDPAGAIDGLNLYRMVLNNPITYKDEDGGETRKKQSNGLWEPVLATGADRNVPGARFIDRGKPQLDVPATGVQTSLEAALVIPQFNQMEVSAGLLNVQTGGYASITGPMLRVGGVFNFIMDRFTSAGGSFNALRFVDGSKADTADRERSVTGYWAPQGSYVDVPTRPGPDDPAYVFTPAFNGCSLTVEQLNDNTLRVRHVEGNKENAQFNNLPPEEHGMGLSAAMEYKDYGFDLDEAGRPEEIVSGFAFMKFDKKQQLWNIHYQTVQGASIINRYAPGKKGWFSSTNASVAIYKQSRVRKTMSKQVTVINRGKTG